MSIWASWDGAGENEEGFNDRTVLEYKYGHSNYYPTRALDPEAGVGFAVIPAHVKHYQGDGKVDDEPDGWDSRYARLTIFRRDGIADVVLTRSAIEKLRDQFSTFLAGTR